jgi:antitoxin ParD1/3/4
MSIILKQEQEKFVLNKLQQGKYENADELFAIAFELLEKNERKEQELIQLKEKILEGFQLFRSCFISSNSKLLQLSHNEVGILCLSLRYLRINTLFL